MGMTNAEKQAAWRLRREAKIRQLEQRVRELEDRVKELEQQLERQRVNRRSKSAIELAAAAGAEITATGNTL